MFDTMTMTKVTASLCGALLIFLLGSWVAEEIYHIGGEGHGDDHHQAYAIEVEGADDHGEDEVEEGPDFALLLASADLGKGERVFKKCQSCHKLESGANGVGPYLLGVVGRAVDAAEGYGYSGALEQAADVWTEENLNGFLENPKGYAPGTSMSFAGVKKPEDRANLIAYLASVEG